MNAIEKKAYAAGKRYANRVCNSPTGGIIYAHLNAVKHSARYECLEDKLAAQQYFKLGVNAAWEKFKAS